MKKFFEDLTKKDVEFLRRQSIVGSATYTVSPADLDRAAAHLMTLYEGRVLRSFASKILLLNGLY